MIRVNLPPILVTIIGTKSLPEILAPPIKVKINTAKLVSIPISVAYATIWTETK